MKQQWIVKEEKAEKKKDVVDEEGFRSVARGKRIQAKTPVSVPIGNVFEVLEEQGVAELIKKGEGGEPSLSHE